MVFYAVRTGRVPGLYKTWAECQEQIHKFQGAQFKKFESENAALNFLHGIQERYRTPVVYADGGSRGNPGIGGCGAVLYNTKAEIVASSYRYLGNVTNNQAEYQALIIGINLARAHSYRTLQVRMDSKVVACQVMGEWKVNDEELRKYHGAVQDLARHFTQFSVKHVSRELNSEADKLANRAMNLYYQFKYKSSTFYLYFK